MKVNKQSYPIANFANIAVGETFMENNCLYMAIEEVYLHKQNICINAVNLETGELTHFCEEDEVEVPEVTVTVR